MNVRLTLDVRRANSWWKPLESHGWYWSDGRRGQMSVGGQKERGRSAKPGFRFCRSRNRTDWWSAITASVPDAKYDRSAFADMWATVRIAYVINSLGVGGTERLVTALADRMAARGHAVTIVVLRSRSSPLFPPQPSVLYLDLRKTPWSLVRATVKAFRALRSFQPDIVHSHNFHGNLLARLLSPFLPNAKLITTVHNVFEGGRMRMLAYRCTDELSDLSVAVSLAVKERYVRLKAVPQRKSKVISNGIDGERFAPDAARREQTRDALGAGEALVWLAAGRLAAAKDYPNLLRALVLLINNTKAIQLWIVGNGDARISANLRELADRLGLAQSVRWLGLRSDIPALLDAADGYVLSSAWEGMPLALGEAMAMEKPIVATDVGGVREMVGDCGTVVPAQDALLLAEAMLATMRMPVASRRALGRAARQRILRDFDIDRKADEWEALYRELLDKKLIAVQPVVPHLPKP